MEWSSIKMSKAEFERLQKAYTAAAMKAAEKAKLSAVAEEVPVTAQLGVIAEAANSSSENTAMTETAENQMSESGYLSDNDIEEATAYEESSDIEISAEDIDDSTEDENAENEPETPESDESTECEDEPEIEQNTEYQNESEENCNDDSSDESTGECDTADEHTDEEILDSFASVFMSEEEADKKVEKLTADKQKNCPPPSFNSAIHNHNQSVSKSSKPCGCEHCRCQNGSHMQEKGGQKPN